jgi:ferredoxin/flavodoxin---NADP+ reductase
MLPPEVIVYPILSNECLAPGIHRLWVRAPHVVWKRQPGQFVIVRATDDGERIPLTVADVDASRGAIALIVQVAGKTTRTLTRFPPGERLLDVAGPLGRPTHITPGARVCCVGGGIGTAVAYPIARAVVEADGEVVAVLGARDRSLVILEEEIGRVASRVLVTTDDGSRGRKGLVTDAVRDLLEAGEHFDEVVAVGPLRMMRAVCEVTRPHGIRTTVSLNPVMVDGTGMCGGCRVQVAGEQKFVCVDGPEFDGHAVDFEEMAARLHAYREQERAALTHHLETCASADLWGV